MSKSLEEIDALVKKCQLCPLHESRAQAVPGEGNPNPDIVFVGEGPGQTEDQTGRPFVGSAGKFLEELLGTIGMKREDVYITNVVKCRPPNNRDPEPDEVNTCTTHYLIFQLQILKPKLICTLGRHAMAHFLPEDFKISSVHGKPYKRHGQVYLPLYHPAAALYHNALADTLKQDFKKIPRILNKLYDRG
ncbi:MAG: uracil-DNA glycosylase [Patescibacteria group bacterium]